MVLQIVEQLYFDSLQYYAWKNYEITVYLINIIDSFKYNFAEIMDFDNSTVYRPGSVHGVGSTFVTYQN